MTELCGSPLPAGHVVNIRFLKRALLVIPIIVALLTVAYGYVVTRRERQYHHLVVSGDSALARADPGAAVAAFGEAIRLKPESMLGYLKRGDALRRTGHLDAAAADLEKAKSLNPTEPMALELLGDVATAQRNYEGAAEHYTACLMLDDRPQVFYKLGLAQHLGGRHREAVEALRQAVKIDARLAEAHYLLGVSLRALKQLAPAQAAFERAVDVAPGLLSARDQLAELHLIQGRGPDRIKQLEELLQLDPSAVRHVTLAAAYAEAGQFPRALRMLRVAADLYPSHAATYLTLGKVWMESAVSGDRAALGKAMEALQQAVSMEASSSALTLLGQARLLASDASGAERTLRRATDTYPIEPDAFLLLADAAERTGRVQVVRRALLDYETLTGAVDLEFLLRLADAHWQSGDLRAARSTVARVLQQDPDNERGRELERQLR